jgi:ABC-type uncharacterized transport system substrate-binding protein
LTNPVKASEYPGQACWRRPEVRNWRGTRCTEPALLHGCALLAPEPEPVEPVPEVVEVPEPVVEVPEPEPEPEPPVVRPAPPPRQVAIVLSSRQEAYEAVANELSERLDNVAIYDLLRAARSSVAMAQVPVVFSQVFNYQDHGLITETSRGVSALPPLDAHLAAWKKLDPTLARVGLIVGAGHESLRTEAEIAAQNHGVELRIQEAGSDQETLYHFKRIIHEIDGFWLFPDNRILSPRVLTEILQQANRRHVPVAVSNEAMLQLGAAISVSTIPSDIAATIVQVLERIRAGEIDTVPPMTQLSEVRVLTNDALMKPEVAAGTAESGGKGGSQ